MEKLIKITELSRKLGLHRATLKRWIHEGRGPEVTLTPGGHYLFKESDIIEWQKKLMVHSDKKNLE